MKRLTFDGLFCDIAMCNETPGGTFCEKGSCSQRKVWERLKEYEDKGVEPDMIEATINGQITLQKALEKYTQAEEQGRLVVLPCAPDATYWEMHGNIPAVSRFDGVCTIDENLDVLFYKNEGDIVRATDIGKTVFLTREEAERALEGGNNDA